MLLSVTTVGVVKENSTDTSEIHHYNGSLINAFMCTYVQRCILNTNRSRVGEVILKA